MHLQKIEGMLLDIVSEQNEQQISEIHLIVKTKEGVWEFIDSNEKPYFYIIFDEVYQNLEIKLLDANFSEEKGTEIKIQEMRVVPKKNEENVAQLFFKNTTDLVAIRDKIKKVHGVKEVREADILFTRRYLIDKSLEPMSAVEIEWNKDNEQNKLLAIKKIDKELGIELNDACFDLETYSSAKQFSNAEKDPIIMIGYVSDKTQKVLSYKHAKFKELELLKNEKECISRLVELIKKEEIDFIYTYNGDSFDFPFIKTRAKKNSIDFGIGFNEEEPKAKRQGIDFAVKIKGVQHVDVFQLMKLLVRFSVINLVKFDLESVVEQLYGEEKTKVFAHELNESWDSGKELEKSMQYNLEDTLQTMRLAKQYLPMIIEFSKLVKQTPFEVSRASASFLVEFLLIDKCFHSEILVPNKPIETAVKKRSLVKYEGGYVREPVAGLHENIAVMDFRSLYPSIMISHNVSPETLNCECCKKEKKNLAPSGDYFCTKQTGFLSSILQELLNKRMKIKNELKKIDKKNPKYQTLFAQQYALKILLNSFYGYLGYARSRWYSFESAQAIASWARYYVKQIAEKAELAGFESLYNDTDSHFLKIPKNKTKKDVEEFVKKINTGLTGAMELELEGFYKRGIFVTKKDGGAAKKRYALLDENGNLKIVGFEYVRRDWSKIAKQTQKQVIEAVLKEGKPDKAIEIVRKVIQELREGKVLNKDLIVFTQLTKSPHRYELDAPHVNAAKKAMKKGKHFESGSIIDFIITKNGKSISEKAEIAEYVKEGDYDAEYYIENQVIPAVIKIIQEFGLNKEDLIFGGQQRKLSFFG